MKVIFLGGIENWCPGIKIMHIKDIRWSNIGIFHRVLEEKIEEEGAKAKMADILNFYKISN